MRVLVLSLALLVPVMAGCISGADLEPNAPTGDLPPLDQRGPTGALLASVPDGVDPATVERLLGATGTYYPTGWRTFEPTIGATSTGAIITNSYAGAGSGTYILRSMDQGQTWEDITPRLPTGMKLVPNSNDPFIYVDPFTDRIYDFDMCIILQGFCVAYSDDDGATWTQQGIAHGYAPALDHQSMAAAPDRTGHTTLYENVLTYCVNRGSGAVGAWCSSSFDGGLQWTPLVPGYPLGTPQCSGLHGHVAGSPDGRFYRGNPSCDGPAVYRSDDGGLTWSEHTIPMTDQETQRPRGHEIAVDADEAGNVYALWMGRDGLPYLAWSTDQGTTWSAPLMVGAPGVTATGFPAIAAGSEGRVAWTYIGTDVAEGYDGDDDAMNWTGYIGFSLDTLGGNATIVNVPVNTATDPLDTERACGAMRCGGFGDFVSLTIDAEGRPWSALAHNPSGNAGIVGTLATGPSLRGDGDLGPLMHGPDLSEA